MEIAIPASIMVNAPGVGGVNGSLSRAVGRQDPFVSHVPPSAVQQLYKGLGYTSSTARGYISTIVMAAFHRRGHG